jgi:hypothetical protein
MGNLPDRPERRRYPRKKSNVHAAIRYGAKGTMVCTILEVSGGGARLLAPLTKLPKTFKLLLSGDAKVARNCEVIWQDGLECGVKFASGPKI